MNYKDKAIWEAFDRKIDPAVMEKIKNKSLQEYKGNDHKEVMFRSIFGNILLMRHSVTVNSQNDENPEISNDGIELIYATAKNLSEYLPKLVKIYYSPLLRTTQTAKYLIDALEQEGIYNVDATLCSLIHEHHPSQSKFEVLKDYASLGQSKNINVPAIFVTHSPNLLSFGQSIGMRTVLSSHCAIVTSTQKMFDQGRPL